MMLAAPARDCQCDPHSVVVVVRGNGIPPRPCETGVAMVCLVWWVTELAQPVVTTPTVQLVNQLVFVRASAERAATVG